MLLNWTADNEHLILFPNMYFINLSVMNTLQIFTGKYITHERI